ncbi:MAG: alpha/beta fold hydrolase [Nocardioidaceae bacterium]
MPLLSTGDAQVEYVVTGTGDPVTVFAHGLAGSIPETRPFGSGVPGSKAFLHFRGHGASSAPDTPWTYAALAGELRAVADHVGATQALGVSLGAGALTRLVTDDPQRFSRLVLVLPAALDQPRADPAVLRLRRMADHVVRRDLDALADLLVLEQPVQARDRADVRVWAGRQATRLAGTGVERALRELPTQHPIDDRAALAAVTCPVLVIGQQGDDAHPAAIAAELADALPSATLTMFDAGGVLWTHRRELRGLVGAFLGGH